MTLPTPSSTPAASHETVRALVGEFLETKARERREEALAESPQRMRKVLAVVSFIVCAIVWVLPSFYRPPLVAQTPERQEASARMSLFLASERVRAFQRAHGRLPKTLTEASVDSAGISYLRSTSTEFDMWTMANGSRVLFRSTTGNAAFLGATLQVLSTGR